MIKATPVISNEFWILKDQNQKVGELTAEQDGTYSLKINGKVQPLGNSIEEFAKSNEIEFDEIDAQVISIHNKRSVYGFPADSPVYNPVYDVKNRLALYTKSPESRSWYAAGYFKMKQSREWETVFCPKLILLERYEYFGPVKDPEDFVFK